MKKNIWLEIAEEAIASAEAQDVSFATFVAGLQELHEEIYQRLTLAEDELAQMEHE